MPAPVQQLLKVGFSPRQAQALHDLDDLSVKQLVRAGFGPRQAKILKQSPDFVRLVREVKFTRHQANLFLRT